MQYRFRLYIAGAKPQSSRAISNLKRICEQYLAGRYEIEVIDIYQDPSRAAQDEVLAVPTLIKESPGIKQKLIGDLSDERRLLSNFGISEDRGMLVNG
jgi:circadian clock protein KaiB